MNAFQEVDERNYDGICGGERPPTRKSKCVPKTGDDAAAAVPPGPLATPGRPGAGARQVDECHFRNCSDTPVCSPQPVAPLEVLAVHEQSLRERTHLIDRHGPHYCGCEGNPVDLDGLAV